MNSHLTDDRELHQLISETARQITSGAPRTGFAARVAARLPERSTRSAWRVWIPAIAMMSAAAVAVMWLAQPRSVVPAVRTTAGTGTTQIAPLDNQTTPQLTTASVTPTARSAKRDDRPRLPVDDHGLPPLAVSALTIDAIQPDRLAVPQLEVKPLGVAPLVVESIGGSGR